MHVCMRGHDGQMTIPPQPSSIVPHLAPALPQVFGLQPQ
jgi:hypothetical protein